jgi:2-C-methyl-D-erythritol 4-phosphate cytidylyltransferase
VIVTGVVLASGDETRLGRLDGRTLIDHAVSALRGSGVVASVLVRGRDELVAALSDADGTGVVVLHDAHRPLAPSLLVRAVVAAVLDGADAAVPVVEVTETVKEVDRSGRIVRTVPRETLVQVQFPQALRVAVLRAGGAALIPPGARVVTVPGAADAFPVRTPHDLELAAAVLAARPRG